MLLKCKKAVTTVPTEQLKIVYEDIHESVENKSITPSDGVILEVQYSGVCHSDIHLINRKSGDLKDFTNRVLGHEITGKIIKVGELVKTFKVNDPVIVFTWGACRKCKFCKSGNSSFCTDNFLGKNDIGVGRSGGGFSTHLILPDAEKYLIKRSANIDPKVAPLLSCSALTAFNAVKTISPYVDFIEKVNNNFGSENKVKAEVLIIGAGGLGQWAIEFCKHLHPKCTLSVVDLSKNKLNMIKIDYKDKVDNVIEFSPQLARENVRELLNGKKMDAVIDFVGTPETSSMGINNLNRGGIYIIIGLMGGIISAPNIHVVDNSLTIKGLRTGTLEIMKEMVNVIEESGGAIKGPGVKLYTLDEINLALDDLRNGKIMGRAVLEINKV